MAAAAALVAVAVVVVAAVVWADASMVGKRVHQTSMSETISVKKYKMPFLSGGGGSGGSGGGGDGGNGGGGDCIGGGGSDGSSETESLMDFYRTRSRFSPKLNKTLL